MQSDPLTALFSARLLHFFAVYESRSFRRASQEIGLSQPALSKSIKALEDQLDVLLFLRSKAGVVPTEAGDALARHFVRLSDLAREADIEISAIRGNDSGAIRIGAGQMWSWLFVPEIVARFTAEFPAVSVEVTTGPMRELVPRLMNAELDIIIGDFDGIDVPEGYLMQQAWSAVFRAFAAADHPLAGRSVVDPMELVKFPWSGYIDQDVFEHNVRDWCRAASMDQPLISIKASSLATLLRLTSAGRNIAVLPSELEEEARNWGLVPLGHETAGLLSVRTGSIVQERRAAVKPFQRLLALVQAAGERPTDYLSPPH